MGQNLSFKVDDQWCCSQAEEMRPKVVTLSTSHEGGGKLCNPCIRVDISTQVMAFVQLSKQAVAELVSCLLQSIILFQIKKFWFLV